MIDALYGARRPRRTHGGKSQRTAGVGHELTNPSNHCGRSIGDEYRDSGGRPGQADALGPAQGTAPGGRAVDANPRDERRRGAGGRPRRAGAAHRGGGPRRRHRARGAGRAADRAHRAAAAAAGHRPCGDAGRTAARRCRSHAGAVWRRAADHRRHARRASEGGRCRWRGRAHREAARPDRLRPHRPRLAWQRAEDRRAEGRARRRTGNRRGQHRHHRRTDRAPERLAGAAVQRQRAARVLPDRLHRAGGARWREGLGGDLRRCRRDARGQQQGTAGAGRARGAAARGAAADGGGRDAGRSGAHRRARHRGGRQ